jgi:hypothetical protein
MPASAAMACRRRLRRRSHDAYVGRFLPEPAGVLYLLVWLESRATWSPTSLRPFNQGLTRMGLRAKFNLVILAAFAVGFSFAAIILNRAFTDTAREQVSQNARIMMTAANAIRAYTAEDLALLLPKEYNGRFVAETVPAYAAQQNLKAVQSSFPGYTYREPTLNPTNLADRAQEWEADIIGRFRNQSRQEELVAEHDTPFGLTLNLARPIVIKDNACLGCHRVRPKPP